MSASPETVIKGVFAQYLSTRGADVPAYVLVEAIKADAGSGKSDPSRLYREELFHLLFHDFGSKSPSAPIKIAACRALSDALKIGAFNAGQLEALLKKRDAKGWTPIGRMICNLKEEPLQAALDKLIALLPGALLWEDSDGFTGMHHLAVNKQKLFVSYLPQKPRPAVRALSFETARGKTLASLFFRQCDNQQLVKVVLEKLDGSNAKLLSKLFLKQSSGSGYAPIHWVAKKFTALLPKVLILLGREAEGILNSKSRDGELALCLAACSSPEMLIEVANDIQKEVPTAFLLAGKGGKTPLHYLAENPNHHKYFFPLLAVLEGLRDEALKIQDCNGFTPLSQMAKRLGSYKDLESRNRAAELMLEMLTPDEWLVQDANAVTPAHRVSYHVPGVLMRLLDHVGDRLDEFLQIEVPYRSNGGIFGTLALGLDRYCKDASVKGFVNALVAKNEADFATAVLQVDPASLTQNLRLRLMAKFVEFASAEAMKLVCEATTAIAAEKARFESASASQKTGVLAVLLDKVGLTVVDVSEVEVVPVLASPVVTEAPVSEGVVARGLTPVSAPAQTAEVFREPSPQAYSGPGFELTLIARKT